MISKFEGATECTQGLKAKEIVPLFFRDLEKTQADDDDDDDDDVHEVSGSGLPNDCFLWNICSE